ncbi:SET domain-containing protein [Lachnellula subtilissima]|uniref:SET domain-containing protein n=1 Tax=Lachnellula subtilissima TaxID=602034 RepID=A0A8H8RXD9_9HELO|nr:SET domain-containing protein [Lachnellula subtilissima]
MGIDAGFDMVPRLSKGAVDRQNWQSFIEVIKGHYEKDDQVELKPNYIVFKVGEHPLLPFEGHKFLRFSSKISGSHANGVEEYIDTVRRVAKVSFGSRVRAWNEGADIWGIYNWQEVNDSFRSYEQPGEFEIPTSIAQYVFGTDPISDLNLPLFSVQPVTDKGKGLVARFNIGKGERILSEKPFFTTQNLFSESMTESSIATKLKALSKTEQRQFLSLHNNFPGKHPFSGIVRTNALPCGSDSVIGGVYPTICLINHSCLPNAHNSWNSDAKCETIHAIRRIKAGEEITISYDKGEPYDARRATLKMHSASLCILPPVDLQASDARRCQIRLLDEAIGDPERVINRPEESLANCHSLLRVLEEEYKDGAGALIARLYYDAFQISITHGDQARASAFAERAFKSRVICEGEDSPETQNMKGLMEKPAMHRNFGASKRWRTAKGLVPKGLDSVGFEKWLWRRGS